MEAATWGSRVFGGLKGSDYKERNAHCYIDTCWDDEYATMGRNGGLGRNKHFHKQASDGPGQAHANTSRVGLLSIF